MSIEKSLEKIAEAIETLAAAISQTPVGTSANQKTVEPLEPADPPAKKEPAKKKAKKTAAEKLAEEPAAEEAEEHSITLADIKDVVTMFLPDRRDEAVELMASFGAEKVGDLKSEDFPDIIEKFNAAYNS
jgi:hypothetical protein